MASLIKLNHKKFLSKSSWNIRGGNTRQCNPPINTAIRRKGSDRFIHKMLDRHESDHRLTAANDNTSADVSNDFGQTSNDSNSNLNRSNDSRGLRRMRGISYSVTDLRELTDKKDFDWLEASDGFQQEIKDRRHEMYIAEIEMDSFHQLGPTIRYGLTYQFILSIVSQLLYHSVFGTTF